jgi:hypothetical protein
LEEGKMKKKRKLTIEVFYGNFHPKTPQYNIFPTVSILGWLEALSQVIS